MKIKMNSYIDVYCAYNNNTKVKRKYAVHKGFMKIKCLECDGTGIFDCGITEERCRCNTCKGCGFLFVGQFDI